MTRELADAAVREEIDLQSELTDRCFDTVSLGIKTLVSGEYGKVEGLLFGMTAVNWSSFEDIGDQSSGCGDGDSRRVRDGDLEGAVRGVPCDPQPPLAHLLPQLLRPAGDGLPAALPGRGDALQACERDGCAAAAA